MKTKIIFEIEEDEELEVRSLLSAKKNQIAIDSLYDEVIRPVIKYNLNDDLVNTYQDLWDKLQKHFDT